MTLALAALCAAAALVPAAALEYDRMRVGEGEAWRLLTGQAVHWTARMAAFDLGMLLGLGFWLEVRGGRRLAALALALGGGLTALAVHVLSPGLLVYRGSSGLASAFFVLAAVRIADSSDRWARGLALAAVALFLAKAAFEWLSGQALFAGSLPQGVHVVPLVHLLGGLGGLGLPAAQCRVAGAAATPGRSPVAPPAVFWPHGSSTAASQAKLSANPQPARPIVAAGGSRPAHVPPPLRTPTPPPAPASARPSNALQPRAAVPLAHPATPGRPGAHKVVQMAKTLAQLGSGLDGLTYKVGFKQALGGAYPFLMVFPPGASGGHFKFHATMMFVLQNGGDFSDDSLWPPEGKWSSNGPWKDLEFDEIHWTSSDGGKEKWTDQGAPIKGGNASAHSHRRMAGHASLRLFIPVHPSVGDGLGVQPQTESPEHFENRVILFEASLQVGSHLLWSPKVFGDVVASSGGLAHGASAA